MIAGKNSKLSLKSSFHAPIAFLDQTEAKVRRFGSRGHQMKNCRLHGDGFSLRTSLIRETRKFTVAFVSSSWFEIHTFDLERSVSKFDLRSDQVKARSWPK